MGWKFAQKANRCLNNGSCLSFLRSFISSFHNPRTTTSNDTIAFSAMALRPLRQGCSLGYRQGSARRTEYGNTRTNCTELFIAIHKFAHDLKYRPGVFLFGFFKIFFIVGFHKLQILSLGNERYGSFYC